MMRIQERPWLDGVEAYHPGRPAPTEEGALASNESPLGASPRVANAMAEAAAHVHRYPSPLADDLRGLLAERHGVDPDQILVGNGSDELIFLLAWAYLANGGRAVCADPAYSVDEISTRITDATLTKVPLIGWSHDLNAMARVDADIAYIVNPHNPTGTVCTRDEIRWFVEASPARLVVADEAYIHFTDDPQALSCLPLVETGRVAVLRTFSKAYGLAGLRVGYLVADPQIIATLRRVRAPFSVGRMAQAAAEAALQDEAHMQRVRTDAIRCRAAVTGLFERAGYKVVPSHANFVLVEASDEDELVDLLHRNGISVRPGSVLGVPGAVRVSVPSDGGLRMLARALGAEGN